MKKNQNQNQNQITNADNIMKEAQKIAYCTVRTLYRGTGSNKNNPEKNKGSNDYKYYLIMQAIRNNDKSNDIAQDLIQLACLTLLEYQDEDERERTLKTYRELHKYIYSLRAIRGNIKTLYIEDEKGEIINVSTEINNLINGTIAHDIINNIIKILTPTQKKVLAYMARGYYQLTIARKLNISIQTVNKHKQAIYKKARALYPNGLKDILFD